MYQMGEINFTKVIFYLYVRVSNIYALNLLKCLILFFHNPCILSIVKHREKIDLFQMYKFK